MSSKDFQHVALNLSLEDKPLIYTAMSKHLFYFRMFISKFVLEQGAVPLNPFMIYDYFLLDSVDRDLVRRGNNTIVQKSDQLWVFGTISDGVLSEIKIAKKLKKPIRYFQILESKTISEINKSKITMEENVKQFKKDL